MRCSKAQHWIQLDLDEELGASQATKLSSHLLACADCRQVRDQFVAIRRALRHDHQQSQEGVLCAAVSFDAVPARRYRWIGAAAAVLIVGVSISAIAGWLQHVEPSADTPRIPSSTPTILADKNDDVQDRRELVQIRMHDPNDSIVVPMPTKNPKVTVVWIYPTLKTADVSPLLNDKGKSAL